MVNIFCVPLENLTKGVYSYQLGHIYELFGLSNGAEVVE